jgi:Na+-transporting NADH:ubiquinone oxidoreductase subunit C
MPHKDSLLNTIIVAGLLCLVCSLLVSAAAVGLKPYQQANKKLDIQRNIIAAGQLFDGKPSPTEVKELFERIDKRLIDIDTGEYVDPQDVGINIETYDPRKAAKSGDENMFDEVGDVAHSPGVSKRERYNFVYEVKPSATSTEVEQYIFPVYGKGLWSTLYGFIGVKSDLNTINGLTFYEHGETPGLGGEVDAQWWKDQWPGKKIYEDSAIAQSDKIGVGVAKGSPQGEAAEYEVDGLSGATITSKGVSEALKYWFSDDAYGKFLSKRLEEGKANG